jgi:Uma2 family endonuclease
MHYDEAMSGTRAVTAEEFLRMGGDVRQELVRGEVVEMSPGGARHSRIGSFLGHLLWKHVEERDPGRVYTADCGYLLERGPDTVRAPDVSFVRHERLSGIDEAKFLPLAPDLAVEVVSPSDSFREVEERAEMWLSFGARLVWIVEPVLEKVFVHDPDRPRQVLSGENVLTGGEVLPGFAVPVERVFR